MKRGILSDFLIHEVYIEKFTNLTTRESLQFFKLKTFQPVIFVMGDENHKNFEKKSARVIGKGV